MDAMFYILPVIFSVVGWATEYWEFYAIAGVLGFYTSFALISEAAVLTNQILTLAVVYLVFSVGILMRIVYESSRTAEVKKHGY
jgi:hypothetical protein